MVNTIRAASSRTTRQYAATARSGADPAGAFSQDSRATRRPTRSCPGHPGQQSDRPTRTPPQLTATISRALAAQTTGPRRPVTARDRACSSHALLAGLALALAVARTLVVPVRGLRRDALEVAHVDCPRNSRWCAAAARPRRSNRSACTPPRRSASSPERSTKSTSRPSISPPSRPGCACRSATCSRPCPGAASRWSSSSSALIEDLEHDEDDPERLQSLFRLDHLATRMRRNGDNLLVLAGTRCAAPAPRRSALDSCCERGLRGRGLPAGRARRRRPTARRGEPAVDIEHLLAELIDNALALLAADHAGRGARRPARSTAAT